MIDEPEARWALHAQRAAAFAVAALVCSCAAEDTSAPCQPLGPFSQVEYLATVEDGRSVVVTRPVGGSYEEMRLFLGSGLELHEREVVRVLTFSDGGTTVITFLLSGVRWTLTFPVELNGGDVIFEPGTLTDGVDTLGVEWDPEPGKGAVQDLELHCLAQPSD